MATLTQPINTQNIVDRFADYVTATANTGISWGTDVYPFPEWTYGANFGGTTSGIAIGVTGATIDALNTDDLINAQNVYDVLIGETNRVSRIRNITAQLFVTSSGASPWNAGTRSTPGTVYNTTAAAHLSTAYVQSGITAARDDVYSGNIVTSGGIEVMLSNMMAAYSNARANNAGTWVTTVCHASCHNSCHQSRGRR